jgi:ferredoxin-type protein NapH
MSSLRHFIQTLITLGTNAYLLFPLGPVIFQGPLKAICHPGLNCYSCPAAVLSCPLGAFQHFLGQLRISGQGGMVQLGTLVVGYIGFIGTLVGRLPCGWLCPFGFIQDLLFKIPGRKFALPRFLSYGKYIVLLLFVVLMPVFLVDQLGLGQPWFCKLICPAGTLLGALPLLVVKPSLWQSIGFYFWNKLTLMILIVIGAILISRLFCRTLCPLGAFYSLFNKVSIVKLSFDEEKCVHCLACTRQCPTACQPYMDANNRDCIRCLKCIESCRFGALDYRIEGVIPTRTRRTES